MCAILSHLEPSTRKSGWLLTDGNWDWRPPSTGLGRLWEILGIHRMLGAGGVGGKGRMSWWGEPLACLGRRPFGIAGMAGYRCRCRYGYRKGGGRAWGEGTRASGSSVRPWRAGDGSLTPCLQLEAEAKLEGLRFRACWPQQVVCPARNPCRGTLQTESLALAASRRTSCPSGLNHSRWAL